MEYRILNVAGKINTKLKNIKVAVPLSLILSFVVFYFVPPIFAQESDVKTRLSEFILNGNDLDLKREKGNNGYGQVLYEFEGQKTQITDSGTTKGEPLSSNGYVTWMAQIDGYWQIFLHNVNAGKTLQLTRTGNNVNPKVSANGKVVWESWVGDSVSGGWQLFLFDGTKVSQITQGDISINADIEGDYIVYARKNSQGLWRSEAYSIIDNETRGVDSGNETEFPKLVNGDIYVGPPTKSQKRYPLKVQDLFLLDLQETPQLNAEPLPTEAVVLSSESAITPSVSPAESPTPTPVSEEVTVTVTPASDNGSL